MKIIFLDHDGVICMGNEWGGRFKKQKKFYGDKPRPDSNSKIPIEYRFDDFDTKAIKVLNEILDETGAEIVISSDWRKYATLEELGEYYIMQGISKQPIGVTEFISNIQWKEEGIIPQDFPWSRFHDLEQERHFEILKWLKDHPETTNWVAIDDLNMGKMINTSYGKKPNMQEREWGLDCLYWTNEFEGIKQSGAKEKIVKILNNE